MGSLIDLPLIAIDDILCRLPIEDAVRTSTLSRAWRHRWKSIPDLDFGYRWETLSDDVITQILRRHGAPIRLFRLLHALHPPALRSCLDILAARSSSSALRVLDIGCVDTVRPQARIPLLEISRRFPHLARLRLHNCLLTPLPSHSDSASFPSLQALDLEDTTFAGERKRDCDLFTYVPACPSLQNLHLSRPDDGRHFSCDIRSIARRFPRLTHLDISCCRLNSAAPRHAVFPSLLTIHLTDFEFDEARWEQFPSAPLLQSLTLNFSSPSRCDLHLLPCKFPRLAELSFTCCSLGVFPHSFPGFNHLRNLEFNDVTCYGQLSALISLCPSLEDLYLNYTLEDEGEGLHVTGMNLLRLVINGPPLSGLSFMSAPLLRDIHIGSNGCGDSDTIGYSTSDKLMQFMSTLAALPALQNLWLEFTALQLFLSDCLPQSAAIGFNNLRVLHLTVDFEEVRQLSATLYLLRSTLNLCKLFLRFISLGDFIDGEVVGEDFWAAQEQTNALGKLEMVKIDYMNDTENELSFIKFVLAKAQVLSKIVIPLGFLENEESTMRMIQEFPKANDQAQILFIDDDCEEDEDLDE